MVKVLVYHELSVDEIQQEVQHFVEAAKRAKAQILMR